MLALWNTGDLFRVYPTSRTMTAGIGLIPHLDPEQLSYIMPLWPAWGMKVDKWASKKKKGKTLSLNCPQFVVKKKKPLCQHTTKSWWCSRFEILPKYWTFLQRIRYFSCPDTLILPAIHSFFSYNLFYLASGCDWSGSQQDLFGHMLVRSSIKLQPSCKKQGIESGPL